jgi:tetratricopeptide (TPR) repeat protein
VFGIWWFILGVLPGAVLLQTDVAKDTRMFLPFVGLALSVTWAGRILLASGVPLRRLEAIVASGLLLSLAYGTHVRNQVWSNEETLWQDTIQKNPGSVRGLLNYAIVLASRGQASRAYEYLRKARDLNPVSPDVEANLGVVTAAMNLDDDADDHFHMAIALAAGQPVGHLLYANWLEKQGNPDKAIDSYAWASSLSLTDLRPRYGLMRIHTARHDWYNLRKILQEAEDIAPDDPGIAPYAAIVRNHDDTVKRTEKLVKEKPTPENFLALSEAYIMVGEYSKSLEASQKALQLRPGYSSAYNNAAAAYIAMGQLEEAIASAKKALEFDPDDIHARANLNQWEAKKLVVGNAIMRK